MRQIICYFLVLVLCGLASCEKKGVIPDMGYNYYPDKVGSYVVYNVDSFYYDDFTGLIDTTKFQIKEKIESVFTDNQNRPTLRLERYIKYFNPTLAYSDMNWILKDVWTSNKTSIAAEKVEENRRFVKLAFPVEENQYWNGNSQNISESETYKYLFFDQIRIIGGIRFDSVLQVTQQDHTDLYNKKYYIEQYARNVGLVFKRIIDVSSQPPSEWADEPDSLAIFNALNIMQRVTSGVQCTYMVDSYGFEP